MFRVVCGKRHARIITNEKRSIEVLLQAVKEVMGIIFMGLQVIKSKAAHRVKTGPDRTETKSGKKPRLRPDRM